MLFECLSNQLRGFQLFLEVGVEKRRSHQACWAKHRFGYKHDGQQLPYTHMRALAHDLGIDHVFSLVNQNQKCQAGSSGRG